MPPKRKFTPDEIEKIRKMSQVRLPVEQMASQMGISKSTFERCLKKDPAARDAVDKGRDTASLTVRNTLFGLAVGKKADPENGRLPVHPDFQALKFWCETQEGFKRAESLEISGPEGRPIESVALTPEQAVEALKKINQRVKITDDE